MVLLAASRAAADPSEPPEQVAVEVAEDCDQGKGDRLADALRTRLGETEVVRVPLSSRDGGETGPIVRWEADEEGLCLLRLVGTRANGSEEPTMALAAGAESTAIRNAASRVTWLLSARDSPPPSPPSPEETPSDAEDDDQSESEEADTEPSEDDDRDSADDSEGTSADERDETDAEETSESDSGTTDVFETGDRIPLRMTLVPLVSHPPSGPAEPVPSYAFNVVGHNYGLAGFEIGAIFNYEEAYADGVQVATVGNWVAGPVHGLQLAGGLNVAAGAHSGIAVAGLANVTGDLRGAALSWGIGNLTIGATSGVQVSGGVNWTTGKTRGMQLGAVNYSRQVAGFQAGTLNVGRQVDGLQLGLVNVAKKSDTSIGLLNFNWGRPAYLMSWMNETGLVSVGVQHGSRHFHNVYRFGYQPFGSANLVVPGFGFGGHFPIAATPLYLDLEAIFNTAITTGDEEMARAQWTQLRLALGWEFGRRLGAFAGATLNTLVSQTDRAIRPPEALPSTVAGDGTAIWPGFFGGVRF